MSTDMAVRDPYVLGLSFGVAQEKPALVVVERVPGVGVTDPLYHHLRYLRRWPLGTPYAAIIADLRTLLRRQPLAGAVAALLADATVVGWPVVNLLDAGGLAVRIVPATITVSGKANDDGAGWRVPVRDLFGAFQVLIQGARLRIAGRLSEALIAALEGFRIRLGAAGTDGLAAGGGPDALVRALALACWWGEVVSPAIIDVAPGEFSAWSKEALRYEYDKRRIKGTRAKPTGPMPEGIG